MVLPSECTAGKIVSHGKHAWNVREHGEVNLLTPLIF